MDGGVMKITDVLRRGKSNGIPLKDLPKACGLEKRAARQAIEKARAKVPIINMQDGSGYFIPTEDEAPLVLIWLNQQRKRIRSLENACVGAEKWLNQYQPVIHVRGYTKRKKIAAEIEGQEKLEE